MRAPAALLAAILLAACGTGPAAPKAKPSRTPGQSPTASAAPLTPTPKPTLRPAGPVSFGVSSIAKGLVAPWALDFASDGAIWLTERPGRVRVIRNGQLLPDPALTLSVFTSSGCEGGLLGIALKEPDAYLFYTYRGGGGPTNRISRFTISGDKLTGEQVILDGIPGGACYHDAGRLKFGPDGLLYATTGEGFVPSRATDPNGLNGKILRLHADGSGREVFAWGFRNPQGIAFDAAGNLYASNNGPTGDLGLCCHDEVDLVRQGGFYGWPEYAANVRTSYGQDGMPAARVPPLLESGSGVWAPSGIAFWAPSQDDQPTLLMTELRGQSLLRLTFDPADPSHLMGQDLVLTGHGRLRDVVQGPDHCAYVLTNNRDTRGSPGPDDDQVLKLCAQ